MQGGVLNNYILFASLIYGGWRIANIAYRIKLEGKFGFGPIWDVIFTGMMIYFLATKSIVFLLILCVSSGIGYLFGWAIDALPIPDVENVNMTKKELVNNYYTSVIADLVIGFISYLVVFFGG